MEKRSSLDHVVVGVSDAYADRISEVIRGLESRGMQVERVLEAVGVVTGTVPRERYDELAGVPGVESVERERVVQLPPPESDVQ